MKRAALAALAVSSAAFGDDAPPQPDLAREILVVAARREEPATSSTASVSSFGAADFERLRPFSVADVVREAPGVYVSPDGPPGQFTRIFIRGAASNQTLAVVDGIPQNDATSGGLFDFGDLGMTGVERVEVLRGSYSTLYGSEAIGGIVNVTTRRGRGSRSSYVIAEAGSFGLRREEAGVSWGDEAFDFAFAVGDAASHGQHDRQSFGSHDAVGRLGVRLSKAVRLDASLRAAVSSAESPFDFATSGVLPADDDIGRRRQTVSGGATLTVDADEWLTFRAIASAFNVESHFDNGGPTPTDPDFTPDSGDEFLAPIDELISRNATTDLRGRLEATAAFLRQTGAAVKCGLGVSLTAGGEHLDQRSVSVTTSPVFGTSSVATTRADDVTRTKSVFAQAELRLPDTGYEDDVWTRNALITLGIREDDHSVFGDESSPYLGGRVDVLGTTLHSSYGEGFRAPKPSELFDPFVGNATLGAETSQSFDVGVSHPILGGDLVVGVTWFRLRVDGLIAFDTASFLLENFSRTETTGFEYEARARLGNGFAARGTLTAQNPRDEVTGLPLANRAQRFGSLGLSWEDGPVRLSVDGYFSGSLPLQGDEFEHPDHAARSQPGRRNLIDLSGRWQATDELAIFAGIRNLLNDAWVATPNSPAGTGVGVYVGVQLDF